MYEVHSGKRQGFSMVYGAVPSDGVRAAQSDFEAIVRSAPRSCTDNQVLVTSLSQMEIKEISQSYIVQVLKWQFAIKDDTCPIEDIVEEIKNTPVWEVFEKTSELLGFRDIKPAQFFAWMGGGGFYKHEKLRDAAWRHLHKEFPTLQGTLHQTFCFDHHFDDSAVENVSTHTPAIGTYILLSHEEWDEVNKFAEGELKNKKLYRASEILEGDFDIYVRSLLILSIFEILLRAACGAEK